MKYVFTLFTVLLLTPLAALRAAAPDAQQAICKQNEEPIVRKCRAPV
jgi:hypothetical protein